MTYDDLIIFVNINFNIKLYIFKIKKLFVNIVSSKCIN